MEDFVKPVVPKENPSDRPKTKPLSELKKPLPPKTTPPFKAGQFIEPLTEIYVAIAMGVGFIDSEIAATIATSAEKCATAWDELAVKNLAVRNVLTKITQGSAFGEVLLAHTPIILALTSKANLLPFNKPNTTNDEPD